MFSRQLWTHKLTLVVLLCLMSDKLLAQERETAKVPDPRVQKLLAEILESDEGPPAELIPKQPEEVRRKVAWELLRQRKRLRDAVLTMLALDEKGFKPDRGILEPSKTILRSLGPKTKAQVSTVLAKRYLSVSKRERQIAASAMQNLDGLPKEAVSNLVRATQSGDEQTRVDACLALSRVTPPPKEAEPALRRCLVDLEPNRRYAAAAGLLAINGDDVEAMSILIDARVGSGRSTPRASQARWALRMAGPKLVQFSHRWRREKLLWRELHLLMQRREKEVIPIMMTWLQDKNSPKDLRLAIVRAFGGLSKISPEVRDTLIAVATEPKSDDYFTYFTLLPLRQAGGFDPDRLAPIVKRNPRTSYIGSFMDTLATCSTDRQEQAKAVRRYMKHANRSVSRAAIERMAKLGCDDKEVVDYVRKNLTTKQPRLQARAAGLAQPMAKEAGLFIDELFALLDDRGKWKGPTNYVTYVNESAVPGLAALGDKALPGLIQRLEHNEAPVRALAARAIGLIKNEKAVDPIAKVLADAHPQPNYWGRFDTSEKVRLEALKALASIGDSHIEHLLPEFVKLLENDWSRLDAIHAIGQVGPGARRLMPRLMAISRNSSDRKTHEALAKAITRIGPTDSLALSGIRLVLKQKKQEIPNQRWQDLNAFVATMKLIQSLEPKKAKLLIPNLKDLVEDEELVYYAVRAYAASALAVVDKDNPRWRTLVDDYKAGPYLNGGRVGGYSIESTIWYHLIELRK